MGKIVFWIALIALIWGGARFITLLQRKNEAAARERANVRRELVISCAHCGVYVPSSEAVKRGDRIYCSEEHARAG